MESTHQPSPTAGCNPSVTQSDDRARVDAFPPSFLSALPHKVSSALAIYRGYSVHLFGKALWVYCHGQRHGPADAFPHGVVPTIDHVVSEARAVLASRHALAGNGDRLADCSRSLSALGVA